MIEGDDDGGSPCEVELHPLLHPRDRHGEQENPAINPTRLMFVRNPNQTINVGISPSPAHILGAPPRSNSHHHTRRHGHGSNSPAAVAPVMAAAAPPLVGTGMGMGAGTGTVMGGGGDEIEMGALGSEMIASSSSRSPR
jgi:hypothetical protein